MSLAYLNCSHTVNSKYTILCVWNVHFLKRNSLKSDHRKRTFVHTNSHVAVCMSIARLDSSFFRGTTHRSSHLFAFVKRVANTAADEHHWQLKERRYIKNRESIIIHLRSLIAVLILRYKKSIYWWIWSVSFIKLSATLTFLYHRKLPSVDHLLWQIALSVGCWHTKDNDNKNLNEDQKPC